MLEIIYNDTPVNLSAPSCVKSGSRPGGHHNFDTENALHDLPYRRAQSNIVNTQDRGKNDVILP